MAHLRVAWLGIDLGTQGVRALCVSDDGHLLARGSHPLQSMRVGARHEQRPDDWWAAVRNACSQAMEGLKRGALGGVAVCGTSGTVLIADEHGRPLSTGLMYDDERAQAECRVANEVGKLVWDRLGHQMQPSWALPKVMWLIGRGIPHKARIMHQSDFVISLLTSRVAPADWSHALKTGYDALRRRWPLEVMEELAIPEAVLPDVVPPGTRVGEVTRQAAEETGIPVGTPVFVGMTDGCAAQIASGSLTPGAWTSILGTTLVLKGVTAQPVRDPLGVVYSHRAPDDLWYAGGASNCGARAISEGFSGWDLVQLTAAAEQSGPTASVVYPLRSRGERFPFRAPDATGFIIGTVTDEVERFSATVQGVAFVERLCFDYIDLLGLPVRDPISFSGATTKSGYWCQMRADVLCQRVSVPANAEPAAGMAILAASGGKNLARVARAMVRTQETYEPRSGTYQRAYLRLVDALHERGWLDQALANHAHAGAAA